MDVFDSRYFKINKFSLSCIGHWVHQTATKKLFTRFLIFLSLTTALIPQFTFLFSVWGDVDAMFECISPITVVMICVCQIGVISYNQEKLRKLVNCMEKDWKYWSSGKELEILQNDAKYGRFFTLLYAVNVFASVFTFVSMSLTPIVLDFWIPLNETRPKQLVYAAKFPFNQDKYFYWILIHGSITAFYNLSIIFTCEAMLAVATHHVCGLFSIISYQLKNVMSFEKINLRKRSSHEIYKEMTSTIACHSHALEFAETLDSCFSPLLFFTVLLNVMCISLLGIQVLSSIDNLAKTIKFGAFTSACLVHLYFISLPAQNLLDRSTELANEAYNGCWYKLPIKSQKLLILIIKRSQTPCKLTAGKFFTMDMITFSMLLKTSVSYFTVLSAMR